MKVVITEDDDRLPLHQLEEDALQFEKALSHFFSQPDLESFQTILDHASQEGNDVLAFKDINGKVWEIVEHLSDDEEGDASSQGDEEEKEEEEVGPRDGDEIDPDDFKLSTSGYAEHRSSLGFTKE